MRVVVKETHFTNNSLHSPEIVFSVCHFAMGLRGFANISDQCFSSDFEQLQPTSTHPVKQNKQLEKNLGKILNKMKILLKFSILQFKGLL